MIGSLPEAEHVWLQKYFSEPNGLTWDALVSGTARRDQLDAVAPWLVALAGPASDGPVILPFYRGEELAGWYATARTDAGQHALKSTIKAWLGSSYLSALQSAPSSNPSSAALQERFGRQVLSFTGADKAAIAAKLALYARLASQRPGLARTGPRPVGLIRSDLEKALGSRDETSALRLIAELRATGRLNEENLKFLDVRLKAGLGQWDQIALDHWSIRNLSELPLPPQTLSDLIEALYRVHLDDAESRGDIDGVLSAFTDQILSPYPRLFASRHGVRTPRIVKAFLLHEVVQPRPTAQILETLADLLPDDETEWAAPYLAATVGEAAEPPAAPPATPNLEPPSPAPSTRAEDGEGAFDDGLFDRAFEMDLALPLHRKSVSRLLSCVRFIGTDEARVRFLAAVDDQPSVHDSLSASLKDRIAELRTVQNSSGPAESLTPVTGWLDWARRLADGGDPDQASADALDNRSMSRICGPYRQSHRTCGGYDPASLADDRCRIPAR